MKKRYLIILGFIFFSGCFSKEEVVISGKTMGTTYNIKIIGKKTDKPEMEAKIGEILAKINSSMSVYDKKSEISGFNKAKKDVPFQVSKEFFKVSVKGESIFGLTNGAWDATIGPLVDLWGFGTKKKEIKEPEAAGIQNSLKFVGYNKIYFDHDKGLLTKKHDDIRLDFASIAKGYGVDKISGFLKDMGFKDFMVEIGGEVYVSGFNKRSEKWRIGINRPEVFASGEDLIRLLSLTGKGVATSGTYRNFININGKEYSHILDPRTGRPVKNRVVSVTVIADECCMADGLATGMLVMGRKEAIGLCERIENTECMIIEKDKEFKFYYSSGFRDMVVDM